MNQPSVRLLLVEDDEDDYVLIRDILSDIPDWTFDLDWADTFDRGLEKAASARHDLCLLDYRLGERTGVELLQRLQETGFGAPVLILTGQGDRGIDLEAMEKGAADYLEKASLSASLVERALRYALDRARTLDALRAGEQRLRELSARLLQAQEEERRRIAKELHDSVGGNLTAVKYALEGRLRQGEEAAGGDGCIPLQQVVDTVQETMEEIQRISSNLRPSILDSMGVLAALKWTARRTEELHTGLVVEPAFGVTEERIPEGLKIVLLRVAQEAVHNAVKHSGGDRVQLKLAESDGMLDLRIQDNGSGFDRSGIAGEGGEPAGMGLESMQERVELSGGSLEVHSSPHGGTSVQARWPLEASS